MCLYFLLFRCIVSSFLTFSRFEAQNTEMHADHPWMRVDGDASDKPLDIAVLTRMKQFRAMNKLKKVALKVSSFFSSVTICITARKMEKHLL